MPLYEYECAACHRRTEKIQKFSDPEMTECPHCGGKLERVLSAPAFSFAGGGWYKDLYSSAKPAGSGETKGDGEAKSSDSGSKPAESGSTSASSSESKPAAAAPVAPASSAPVKSS